jgi:hypothetical protein
MVNMQNFLGIRKFNKKVNLKTEMEFSIFTIKSKNLFQNVNFKMENGIKESI